MDAKGKGRPGPVRSKLAQYGIAVLCTGAAFAVRYSLTPLIGGHEPFMVFAAATLLAARFGGLGPGVLSLFLGLVIGDFFFTFPAYTFGPYDAPQITEMVTYTITTLSGVILLYLLHRSREQVQAAVQRAEAAADEAQRRGAELEREIAERRRAEADLQRAQKQLSNYATELEQRVVERTDKLRQSLGSLEAVLYHVAHDLRAPLRAMQGFTTMLLSEYVEDLDDKGKDYARRISGASRRMDDLLRDLLEYGRVCSAELFPSKVRLETVVNEVVSKACAEVQNRSATVEIVPPLATVWADTNMVRDITFHILSNALKFVKPGVPPHVRISSELHDGRVRLWMEDNGIGIEPEHQERIFDMFERLNAQGDSSGTGIGLAIVRRAVERVGGAVGVESRVGKGSRFWIELPAA